MELSVIKTIYEKITAAMCDVGYATAQDQN